jgi:hypothetical protein
MKHFRGRITSAHVIALIALFVAMGGTVYAAGKINGRTIKTGSIPGNRLARNGVTGAQVNEGTLGQVPSAANAANATNAGSANNADRAKTASNAVHANTADNATAANSAKSADDAKALGGVAAAKFQQSCAYGLPKGIARIDTSGLTGPPTSFVAITGAFNCGGGQVEVARLNPGEYQFVFNGLASKIGEPSTATTETSASATFAQSRTAGTDNTKRSIIVRVLGATTGNPFDNQTVDLVLY